jgi:hypothetical protein
MALAAGGVERDGLAGRRERGRCREVVRTEKSVTPATSVDAAGFLDRAGGA